MNLTKPALCEECTGQGLHAPVEVDTIGEQQLKREAAEVDTIGEQQLKQEAA